MKSLCLSAFVVKIRVRSWLLFLLTLCLSVFVVKIMKNIRIIFVAIIITFSLTLLHAEEEIPIEFIGTNALSLAPTNRSYVDLLFTDYKIAIEEKNVDKYLACISTAFSKEMVDTSQGFTNRFF